MGYKRSRRATLALSAHTMLQKHPQPLMSANLTDHDLEPRSFGAENDVESSDCGSSDEGSDLENFLPVLNVIDLNALISAAIDARRNYDRQKSTIASLTSEDLTCVIQTPPLIGSFNLAFVILFSDGVKWIARVPGSGVSSFGQLETKAHLKHSDNNLYPLLYVDPNSEGLYMGAEPG